MNGQRAKGEEQSALASSGGGLVRLRRVKNRVYRDHAMRDSRVLVSHAEYGLFKDEKLLVRIVFNRGKWIAMQVSSENEFGKPVSPINYVLLRDVREWVIERFGG